MIATAIAGGLSALGSIIGSSIASSEARKAKRAQLDAISRAETRNDNNLNYQLGTPRYASTTILNQTADAIRDRKQAREGTAKVIGGTQAAQMAGNQQDLSTLANVTETAISQGLDDRKNAYNKHTETANALDAQRANVEYQAAQLQANAVGSAIQGVSQAAGMVASAFDGTGKTTGGSGKTTTTTTTSTPQTRSFNEAVSRSKIENPFTKNNNTLLKSMNKAVPVPQLKQPKL